MAGHSLVIGVDLGTTYTGVSFCDTLQTDNIENRIQIVSNWPAVHTMIGTRDKTPTEITYLGGGIKWGAGIPPNIQRHIWTKLELDTPRTGESAKIRQELHMSSYGGVAGIKRPVDIIADFLAEVLNHLIKNLDEQYTEKLWKTFSITLVVTYPAVWSDSAKALTLQAFSKAGFNTERLPLLKNTITATEPEAAAIYTIVSTRGSAFDQQFAVGDGFLVCDMGGGTVDLISYRVVSTKPTAIEELTVGTGDQCGGSFVERAFLSWLERKLGVIDFHEIAGGSAADLSRTSLPPKLGKLLQEFTATAKTGFKGLESDDYEVRLPAPLNAIVDDPARTISNGEILITPKDLIEMFRFPLRRTQELALEQVEEAKKNGNTKVTRAFLVGGFAESVYMKNELQKALSKYGVSVIKPRNAWSAIARGATAIGLEKHGETAIKGRKCRRHYGTPCSIRFHTKKHREMDAYIHEYTGEKMAGWQVTWLVSKGQDLATSKEVHGKVSMHSHFWPDEKKHDEVILVAADTDNAPPRSRESAVYNVAILRVDLDTVPKDQFRKRRTKDGSDKLYYELHYEIRIAVQSALEYSLWVKDKRYGAVTADYA